MIDQYRRTRRTMTDGTEGFAPCPELLTEDELALFLRIPEVSNSRNHHNVIEHLKRYRGIPRIHICNRVLYPTEAIRRWIEKETINGN